MPVESQSDVLLNNDFVTLDEEGDNLSSSQEVEDIEDDESIKEENINEESVAENIFDELFLEAYLNDTDSSNANNYLVQWLCLFLAHWQNTFNITDNALEFLLKFIYLFFEVFRRQTTFFPYN